LILNTSLPQNGAVRAKPHIVAQPARYDCDTATRTSKNAAIAGGPHVTPASLLQRLDDVADS
jgi:hypothetical protein